MRGWDFGFRRKWFMKKKMQLKKKPENIGASVHVGATMRVSDIGKWIGASIVLQGIILK